jgi:hypothetical protein
MSRHSALSLSASARHDQTYCAGSQERHFQRGISPGRSRRKESVASFAVLPPAPGSASTCPTRREVATVWWATEKITYRQSSSSATGAPAKLVMSVVSSNPRPIAQQDVVEVKLPSRMLERGEQRMHRTQRNRGGKGPDPGRGG